MDADHGGERQRRQRQRQWRRCITSEHVSGRSGSLAGSALRRRAFPAVLPHRRRSRLPRRWQWPNAADAVTAGTARQQDPAPQAAARYSAMAKRVAQPFSLPVAHPPTFRTALGALRRNKMRSALTALGVIIGVAAVIAMTEIGEGSKAAIEKTIASMGANNILVLPGAAKSGGVSWAPAAGRRSARRRRAIDPSSARPSATVAPIVRRRPSWSTARTTGTPQSVIGTHARITWKFATGKTSRKAISSPTATCCKANKVCLIGTTIKRELFDNESPIGKDLRIRNVPFASSASYPPGRQHDGPDQDDIVIAPWTTIKFRVNAVLGQRRG